MPKASASNLPENHIAIRLVIPLRPEWVEDGVQGMEPTAEGILKMLQAEYDEIPEPLLKEFPGTAWRVQVRYNGDVQIRRGVTPDED